MTTPPRVRVVCNGAARLRTLLLLALFTATSLFAGTAAPADPHRKARALMAEARQTSNPLRLFMLAIDIRESLEEALRKRPHDVDVLLDLVRFHTVSPRIVGGDVEKARSYTATVAALDEGCGHFAKGYMAYREKQFGVARRELQSAVEKTSGEHRVLALQWLGWLSQESQQYADAFAAWDQLRASDPHALYEIARTSVFCRCERERGKAALTEYLRTHPKDPEAKKLREQMP